MVIKTNFGTKQASESSLGLVRFATNEETVQGLLTNKVVSPKGVNDAINSIMGLVYNVILLANNWIESESSYTYVINSITGIDSNTNIHTTLSSEINKDQVLAFRKAMIVDGGLDVDSIALKALGVKPNINIPINIIVSNSLYLESNYEQQL